MPSIVNLERLFHRTKDRIKNLGEVFTPESYVDQMLDMLSKDKKGFWGDEDIIFFEPCSGHGNIANQIYKRRLEGIYKKATIKGLRDPAYYAVANAINTLWAIDIDKKNIESCRARILATTLCFIKSKLDIKSDLILLKKDTDFFTHVISAIKWHVSENETLSALSTPQSAMANANLTKVGAKWFSQNGHRQLDFALTWVDFYERGKITNTIPLEYKRSKNFIQSLLSGKIRNFDDFEFVELIIQTDQSSNTKNETSIHPLLVGV